MDRFAIVSRASTFSLIYAIETHSSHSKTKQKKKHCSLSIYDYQFAMFCIIIMLIWDSHASLFVSCGYYNNSQGCPQLKHDYKIRVIKRFSYIDIIRRKSLDPLYIYRFVIESCVSRLFLFSQSSSLFWCFFFFLQGDYIRGVSLNWILTKASYTAHTWKGERVPIYSLRKKLMQVCDSLAVLPSHLISAARWF